MEDLFIWEFYLDNDVISYRKPIWKKCICPFSTKMKDV
jgi:hypothetical protein